ncbi:MAG: periplasmic heavy metal sensor [Proteobacteria bacterium]|nr:periplasmic heavy metal sensor [Pseudomonadota bacterium]
MAGEVMGAGRRGGPGHPCMALLLHAPPPMLKAKLGLDEAQIKKVQGLRDALMGKGIDLRAQAQKQQLALKKLLEQDLPQEAAVLEALRKLRGVRGQLQEERVKAMLQVLAVLSAPQRAKLRAECPGAGVGMGGHGCPFCGEMDEEAGGGPGCGAGCGCPQCKGAKGPGCGADCACSQCMGGKRPRWTGDGRLPALPGEAWHRWERPADRRADPRPPPQAPRRPRTAVAAPARRRCDLLT